MTLHVHPTGGSLLNALRSERGAYYATLARSSTDAAMLGAIEVAAVQGGHTTIDADEAVRAEGERLLREFFDAVASADPHWRYAFSSRVLLAVPDYPDVALLFMLRAIRTLRPDAVVHALVEDDRQANLASFDQKRGTPQAFAASGNRAFLRSARAAARRVFAAAPEGRRDVVIVTLGANLAEGSPDAYFGNLAPALAAHGSVMTVYLAPGKRVRFPASADAVPLEAFLRLGDPAAAWWRRNTRDPAAPPEPYTRAMLDYLRAREEASGETAMQEVMARAFDRMLATLQPRVLVYPFENRSWEKNLLDAARRHGVARCVGYQHSSLTPRHLAFSGAPDAHVTGPVPDLVVTCGEITAARVRAAMPERVTVTVGAALRARRFDIAPPHGWGLLAPISSSRAEAWEILRTLHALCGLVTIPMTVRTHPTIPIEDLYGQFRWPARMQLSRGRPLAADIQAAALVVYSSSTIALEGMLYGRLPIYLEIGDVPSGNPIEGEHEFVFRARDAAGLAQVIAEIQAMPQAQLDALRADARAYAERYLVEPSPANVERMAGLIAAC
ncbi:MAG: hypothetical protein JWM26_584 [Betaproteobacteria bacterium]|nr:hypothetical protein [Betaproteobacteria bacterium]